MNITLAEVLTSLNHLKLDEECKLIFANYLLEERAINQRIRDRHLAYTRPFIDAGFVKEADLNRLSLQGVRAVIWQVRRCIDPEDPLRHARIPKLSLDL